VRNKLIQTSSWKKIRERSILVDRFFFESKQAPMNTKKTLETTESVEIISLYPEK